MMDEREIDSHNRGPLPNTLASASVTSAIDEAERQNRQRAIAVAAAAVIGSIIAAFILLQILSGGDDPVSTAASSETEPLLADTEDPVAFDTETPSEEEITPVDEPDAPATASTAAPSTIDVSGFEPPSNPVGSEPMTLRGMGDLVLGMTVAEAEAAIGGTIIEPTNNDANCVQTRIGGDTQSPVLMIVGTGEFSSREIVRIDMVSGNATRSGIGIASLATEVTEVYGERIVETADTLTYVPADDIDADYRIVMDIVGDVVLSAHNGQLPYANWDGCES